MLTPRQRELRRRYIGASDAPAILGLSPFATISDIYWAKVAETPDQTNEAMSLGNWLEPSLCEWAGEKLGKAITRRNTFRVHPNGFMAANQDAWIADDPKQGIEAKFVGPEFADLWGEEETDQVPDYVMAQCQHQMYVADLSVVWVPALICRFRPVRALFRVERHDGLIDAIVQREKQFWERHVLPKLPPTDDPPPMEVLRYMRRVPGSIAHVDPEIVRTWQAAREARLTAAKVEEEAQRRLLAALGECEAAEFGDETQILTYLPQKSTPRVDHDRLRADGLWDTYCTQGEHRTLRLTKKKGPKSE